MGSRFLLVILLSLSVLLVPVGVGGYGDDQRAPDPLNGSISHLFDLNVVFVGFNETVVDTGLIDSNTHKQNQFFYGSYVINYNLNVTYMFANSSYYEALKATVMANSVNGTDTTSAVNTTALQIQKSTGEEMSIFTAQSGRAIDASAVEEWLETHPYTDINTCCYWFYVLNFTEFDSSNHSVEHWYNATELDFEAGNTRDFWRLEWDNLLNQDVRFPYACFTSDSRVVLIDPSAFQWYLTWARIWWGLQVSGPKFDYYYEDLDQFLATHDVSTSQGKTDLAYYLSGWIDDAIRNLLAPSLYTSPEMSTADSMSIQVLVLNNASQFGYTHEAMSWILNASLVREAIEDLAPFMDIEVVVRFQNLSELPEIETIFKNAAIEQTEGRTYYDGFQVWDGIYAIRTSYFDFDAADVVINGYIYLENNMSMIVYGGEYTGLGGSGQILVMKTVERYFQEDGVTPKSGLGLVLIHEAGHNFGFPHTFIHGDAYAGDFAFDVMGYYPYSFYFSKIRKDCFRRLVVDFKVLSLRDALAEDLTIYQRKPPAPEVDLEFENVDTAVNDTLDLYEELRFLEAYDRIVEAGGLELQLKDLIWIYICDFSNDGVVNLFDAVELLVAYGSRPGDAHWNAEVDLIQDDVVNLFDAVLLLGYYGAKWRPT